MRRYMPVVLLFLCLVLILPKSSTAASALPHQFEDIHAHWAQAELEEMIMLDVLNGYEVNNRYFAKPNKPITRVEFAALMAKTLKLKAESNKPEFADWEEVPGWARGAVAALEAQGIINGIPGSDGRIYFRPGKNITRAEIAAIMVNALEEKPEPPYSWNFADVPAGKWYSEPILQAKKMGLMNGRTTLSFEPQGKATRVEVIVVLNRFLKGENYNLPGDEELLEVVQGYMRDLEDVLYGREEAAVLKEYTTGGAALALDRGGLGILETTPVKTGISSIRPDGSAEVVNKNKRIAVVDAEWEVELEVDDDYINVKVVEQYHLTKINGRWKIYNIDLVEQQIYN